MLGLERLDTMTLMANNLATEEERPSTPDVSSPSTRQSTGDSKTPTVGTVYTGSGERSAKSIALSCLAGAERMGGVRRALEAGLSRDEPQRPGKTNALKEEEERTSHSGASNPRGSPLATQITTSSDTSTAAEMYAQEQHVEGNGSAPTIDDDTLGGTPDGKSATSKQSSSPSQTHSDDQAWLVRRRNSSPAEQRVVSVDAGDRNGTEQPQLATPYLSNENVNRQNDDLVHNLAQESTTPPRQSEGEQGSSPMLVTALTSFRHRTRRRTGSSGDAGSDAESYTSALSSLREAVARGTPGGRRTLVDQGVGPLTADDASSVTSSDEGTSFPEEEEEENSDTTLLTPQRLTKGKDSPRSLHRGQDSTATDLSLAVTPVRPVLARADVFSPQPRGVLAHMDDAEEDGKLLLVLL